MKRWKHGLVWLALAASGLAGCKQQLFIQEKDLDHYKAFGLKGGAGENLDVDPSPTLQAGKYSWPEPATVNKPDRKIRFITLQEALAVALEQGNTGSQNSLFPGQATDTFQFGGRQGILTDTIRVLSLDPAVAGADIDASLAKFDTRFLTSMTWGKTDNAILNGLTSFNNGDTASFSSGMYKPLPTGGVAGITFAMDYAKLENPASFGGITTLNPSYRPRLQLQFEQPLLRNYGVEINQLNPTHNGATIIPGLRGFNSNIRGVEGIMITRLRYDQSKADFERAVNFMLLNVETAYWNLYAAYGALYARDEAIVEALDLWKIISERAKTGLQKPHEEARARAQLELFRAQRITELGNVLETERHLRSLMGLGEDGTRLVPVDTPVLAPFTPDWESAMNEAVNNRPELILARQDLKFRQFDIMLQKNMLKPDLQFFSSYDINGIGTRLDGSTTLSGLDPFGQPIATPHNALGSLADNRFNTWQLGLRMEMPLGFRDAHAAVRVARLGLYRSYYALRDSERKVLLQLEVQYRRLAEHQRSILARREQYRASALQYYYLEARSREIEPDYTAALEAMLNAQQSKADARSNEFKAIADYNNALAGFQFAKGSILSYDNVVISEGQLPQVAQVRAADHIRERMNALLLRERAAQENAPAGAYPIETGPPIPDIAPAHEPAPNVPKMMQNLPKSDTPVRAMPPVRTDLPRADAPVRVTPPLPNELPRIGDASLPRSGVVPAATAPPVWVPR